jgi:hypothetical protein
MDHATTEYLFRGPRSTPEARGGRSPEHRFENRPGMPMEKDIAVPHRNEGHVMYGRPARSANVGRSVVHTGGRFDSHLVVPVLPPRG